MEKNLQNKNNPPQQKSYPWQARWWREKDNLRWAGTFAIVILLIGIFINQNPAIWQTDYDNYIEPLQISFDTDAELAEIPSIIGPLADDPINAINEDAILPDETTDDEDLDEDNSAMAVGAAPEFWQPPALGTWQRSYGYAFDPTNGDYRFHKGCDMFLAIGDLVFAVAEGVVSTASEDAKWGGIIVIDHGGGWQSMYMGVLPSGIKVGDTVIAGDTLGTVLPSPPAEAVLESHLHFELLCNGKNENPAEYIK